ncbi:MAG: pirin family protein [Lautropia sp.]
MPTLLMPRTADIGPFTVRRLLPNHPLRSVGPFVFFDHFGPAQVTPATPIDVPPHPHIGLATVTYLLAGSMMHRDSLGTIQRITPGDVNWMTAGRGIVHSERRDPAQPATPQPHEGLQLWVGLPRADEACAPRFAHHPAATLPTRRADGVALTLIAGTGFGMTAPVAVASPLGYVSAELADGSALRLAPEHPERAVYVVAGAVTVDGTPLPLGRLLVLDAGGEAVIAARGSARVMILMGAPLDGPRFLDWNFVGSDRARLAQARADWAAHRFATISGDDRERVELPAPRPGPAPAG